MVSVLFLFVLFMIILFAYLFCDTFIKLFFCILISFLFINLGEGVWICHDPPVCIFFHLRVYVSVFVR